MKAGAFVLEQFVRPWRLHHVVRHVAGPRRVQSGPYDVVAICIVRNGAQHVESFVEHHRRLGVRHIVFLDNESTDDTVAIARRFDHVTMLQTEVPYARYENTMKRYLARRFSPRRWNLCVDIDERFDYPGSDSIRLPEMVRYLERHRYTAVVAHMLDLFPDAALEELERMEPTAFEESHRYYDLSAIRTSDYVLGKVPDPRIRMYWDGIRYTLFGTQQGLTKAPLVRVDRRARLFTFWHHVPDARVADFTAVLLHYPFAGSFHAKVRDAVAHRRYGGFTEKNYDPLFRVLTQNPETRLRRTGSHVWRGIEALVEEGFLIVSPGYRQWCAAAPDRPVLQDRESHG